MKYSILCQFTSLLRTFFVAVAIFVCGWVSTYVEREGIAKGQFLDPLTHHSRYLCVMLCVNGQCSVNNREEEEEVDGEIM